MLKKKLNELKIYNKNHIKMKTEIVKIDAPELQVIEKSKADQIKK